MSRVRMRVANSDWCASRMLVSVSRTAFCSRIHAANFSGPSCLSKGRNPAWTGGVPASTGRRGGPNVPAGAVRPRISGLPCTVVSPMNCSSLVAVSLRAVKRNSLASVSMKRVV